MNRLSVLILFLWFFSCKQESSDSFEVSDLEITWSVIENLGGTYTNNWKITNQGDSTFPSSGWTIYYNHTVGVPVPETISGSLKVTQVSGTFYSITPTESFRELAHGESTSILLECYGSGIKITDAPGGLYLVFEGDEPQNIENFALGSFPPAEFMRRTQHDLVPIPTAESIYRENEYLSLLPVADSPGVIPTPRSVLPGNGTFEPGDNLTIGYQKGLENEARLLQARLEALGQFAQISEETDNADISLAISPFEQIDSEHYKLKIKPETISIVGPDTSGVFYGTQSLISLWPLPGSGIPGITCQTITDGPRFAYRGMHLDVARNFQKPDAVKKVLDIMSFYKLNRLHFHLTDDEGWRLEIEGIPELTGIGAVRGHTTDETDHLMPAYGSGPFPHAADNYGTGYYSQQEFIDILQYAAERHIEVIPEINFPGHARAAVKSMSARARRIEDEGSDEPKYLLHDPNDRSEYRSVQGYTDNVICPCQESVYRFIEKVVAEIVTLYQQAGVRLSTIHTGGDEVPAGIWEQSPLCAGFLKENPQIEGVGGLSGYFLQRYHQILEQQDLITAGWEEIAMHKQKDSEIMVPNPQMVDKKLLPYVWNSNWGTHDDLAYKLANMGYRVVMCNANNLYFDFAYSKDPQEPGFYWSGLVNTKKPFELVPLDVMKTATVDIMGNPIDIELYQDHEKLTPEAGKNILGIQGQLWSETVKGPELLEYYLFPKMIGLSERAWTTDPDWVKLPKRSQRLEGLDQAWNEFANTIAQRELARLDHLWNGVNYRVPPPGAVIEDGILKANVAFPGLEIRYTLDGREPNENSALYQEPFEAKKPVKLKAFTSTGKASRTSVLSY